MARTTTADRIKALEDHVDRLSKDAVPVETLTFSWRIIASIVISALTLSGAFLKVSGDISAVGSRVDSAAKLADERATGQKLLQEAQSALEKERSDQLKEAIDGLQKGLEMRRIEVQQLRDIVTAKGR